MKKKKKEEERRRRRKKMKKKKEERSTGIDYIEMIHLVLRIYVYIHYICYVYLNRGILYHVSFYLLIINRKI